MYTPKLQRIPKNYKNTITNMRYAKWLTALKMESSRTSQRFKTGLDSIHISLFGWLQEIPNPQIDGKITTLILSGWSQETDNRSLPNWRPDQNSCSDTEKRRTVWTCKSKYQYQRDHLVGQSTNLCEPFGRGHCWRLLFWATPKGGWPGMRHCKGRCQKPQSHQLSVKLVLK